MDAPGAWMGEGSFLTRQPRRIELTVRLPTVLMHLSFDQMDRMAHADREAIRAFSLRMVNTVDVLIRIVSDLQQLDPDQRTAATIDRAERDVDLFPDKIYPFAFEMEFQFNIEVAMVVRLQNCLGVVPIFGDRFHRCRSMTFRTR